jgi:hypothetical protein
MIRGYSGVLRYGWVVALAAAVLVAGCARPRASVSGKVTYKGKPVTSGNVVIIGQDGKASPPGAIGTDGSYVIDGAPVGHVKAAVDNPPPPEPPPNAPKTPNDPEVQQDKQLAARYVATPPQYRDPKKSGLEHDLQSGSNTWNIELK